jgi:hypothetical protein
MLERPIDRKVARYLRENRGIDAVLLAADLKLDVRLVVSYQRRLGLRGAGQV